MTILFGHPTGTPFSHHAALAHFDARWLESFCVPWMPSASTIRALEQIGTYWAPAQRLGRRGFAPLTNAPKIQGRLEEVQRLLLRAAGHGGDHLSNQANDWLMRTMAREAQRASVTAVHAYEDCSEDSFVVARRLGKACLYEMPIGYYPAWERIRDGLNAKYADWAHPGGVATPVRRAQKVAEMELADLVLAPSRFVAETVREFHPDKPIAITPYGVDLEAWPAREVRPAPEQLRFLFAGQCSVRKGVPLLIEAWRACGLRDASLTLVGPWQLAAERAHDLPANCRWIPPVSSTELRSLYGAADVFVFPTNFEGRALVVLEALASGLAVLTTDASGGDDAVGQAGRVTSPDDLDGLVEALKWFNANRDALPGMSVAARAQAEGCSWDRYQGSVVTAVRPYL